MKTKNIYLLLVSICLALIACNDEWKDELYRHMISFKAPVNGEGVADVYLRYKPNGEVVYSLPVLISGSTLNNKPLDVQIETDNDTLDIFNSEKFQYRDDLYYKQLPERFYEFVAPSRPFPAGSNKELFEIKFKFDQLDLSEEWVLPLTIKEDPSYEINTRKGWGKALLHVLPFNNYSGKYVASAMNIYFADSNTDPMVIDERRGYVVDENTIFFYAGTKLDKAIDRRYYKIYVKFEPETEETETSKKGKLTVSAEHAGFIKFEVIGEPTYEIREETDATLPYLLHRYFILTMSYKYDDVTSVPENPISYRAEGSMTMERKIDTTIPDEDQAIEW